MGSLNMDALLYGCIEIHPYRDIIPNGIDGMGLYYLIYSLECVNFDMALYFVYKSLCVITV